MRDFTFLHMADVHLGPPTGSIARLDASVVGLFGQAVREAFVRLMDVAIERNVDFVVIAGDLYDREWKDARTGIFFAREAARLERAGIAVYLIKGNHDAASVVTSQVRLPTNVHVFDEVPQTFEIDALGVALHGQSYADRQVPENIAADYPRPVSNRFNIGILHTSLTGREGHDTYAPCSADQLAAHGYDYWALGHIHQREVVREHPPIVFPGNVQGRHIGETGARGATIVTVERGVVSLEAIEADVVRWERLTLEVRDGDIGAQVEEAARSLDPSRPTALRVKLQGETEQHDALAGDATALRSEVQLALHRADADFWLEKIELATRRPLRAADGDERDIAAVPEGLTDASEVVEGLAADLAVMRQRLPAGVEIEIDDIAATAMSKLLGRDA